MAEYRLLVTEITNFGDLRCVAGWDLDRSQMIRPEPFPRGFWSSDKTAPGGPFKPGGTANFVAKKPSPSTEYPHLTEDRVVAGEITIGAPLEREAANELLQSVAFSSLDDLFEDNLVVDGEKAYVPVGSECRSLGGLVVPTKGVIVESYQNYIADYERMASAPLFNEGIDRVLKGALKFRIALLCSEQDPLDCHRCLLVSRELLKREVEIQHILSDGSLQDQRAAESRLQKLSGSKGEDLFMTPDERLAAAYRHQSRKVAFSEVPRSQKTVSG
jgi:Protein of unknown function, DUF488